jgi:hypothetical protein
MRKNETFRLFGLSLFVLLLGLVAILIYQSIPNLPLKETFILPVNTNKDVLTTYRYAGNVTIIIRGYGSIDENTSHDAVIKYPKGKGQTISIFDGFLIDGKSFCSLTTCFPLPRPGPNGEHRLIYNVGPELKQIGFRILNGNDQDNAQFTIEVLPSGLYPFGKREP